MIGQCNPRASPKAVCFPFMSRQDVLSGGATFSVQWVQVVKTDPSMGNLSTQKAMRLPLSEMGRLGKSGSQELSFHM